MLNYRILNFVTRARKKSIYSVNLMNSQNCHLCLKTGNKFETKINETEPIPKSILYKISSKVKATLKKDMELKYVNNYSGSVWHSSLSFTWPFNVQTSGTATSKREAENLASAAAVNILKQKDIVNEDGQLKSFNKILQNKSDMYLRHNNENTEITDNCTIEGIKDHLFDKMGSHAQNDVSNAELEMVLRRFPQPTETLNNVYADVSNQLQNSSRRLKPSHYLKSGIWHCVCKVLWPTENIFSAKARTKAQATKIVALRILHWLTSIGHLTREGYARITLSLELPPPYRATWPAELSDHLDTIVQQYKNVEHVFNKNYSNEIVSDGDFEENDKLMYSFHSKIKNQENIDKRNSDLLRKYINRKVQPPYLPINDFRDQLLDMLQINKAVVVKGEPGCGKSTQVPQFIMDSWTDMGQGADCNIIISQPRRISAISIAKRVAYEREEMLGDVVGYHVRLDSQLPCSSGGSLLYATSGILLKYMQSNPTLSGVSHIILDEAHERSTDIDMLMVLLRRALNSNQELKLIVMSATVDARMFQKYFDASILEVPGFTYPVKQHFLEDMHDEGLTINFDSRKTPIISIDASQVAEVIKWVHLNRPEGAILCFLPGWSEIQAVRNRLNEMLDLNVVQIIPAHSRLSHHEQGLIFRTPPSGIRKIILATNIAETSITINDVLYVVDTGILKEQRLDVKSGLSTMGNHWASQTNIKQRKGRAGRVQPGESFHIFSRERYSKMDIFPTPEVLRVPLVKTVLDCKVFSETERAVNFLAEMPNSPSALAIDQAINELIEIGALDKEENLTPLGKRISTFTTHPKLSKTLVNASILGCIKPILTIISILSGGVELFLSGLTEKENIRNIKLRFHPTSDHLALANIHSETRSKDLNEFKTFCLELGLNMSNINLLSKLNSLFSDSLYKCQILDETEEVDDELSPCNKNCSDDEFIKCALLSGFGNLLIHRSWDIQSGRLIRNKNINVSESGHYVTLTSESVNHKLVKCSSPFLTYFHKINSLERQGVIVRESSHVSPLSVLLFKNGILDVCETTILDGVNGPDDNVLLQFRGEKESQMLCGKRSASKISQLRDIVWNTLNFFIKNKGITTCEEYESVLNFQAELYSFLRKVINHSASKICR